MVTHNCGMPFYLHKQSRVCTASKPYFLGSGSVRKHSIPVSAIPCLHYRREKEKIAKNHEPVQNSGEEPVQSSESVPNQSTEPVKTNAYKSVQVQSSNSVPVSTSEAEPVQTNDRAPEPVQQNGGVEENVTQNGATTENPDQQPPNRKGKLPNKVMSKHSSLNAEILNKLKTAMTKLIETREQFTTKGTLRIAYRVPQSQVKNIDL